MSDENIIAAEPRERAGKGAARAARRAGQVPGVIYGAKKEPSIINISEKELVRELSQVGFFARLYELRLGKAKEKVLARDVQFHPVSDRPIHIDFLRVSASSTVTVAVPCSFINEEACPGLVQGGVLNVVRYELDLVCRADAMPAEIEIDLTGLEFGDGVHISSITLPDGVESAITDRDFTICTIAAPVVHVEEKPEEEDEYELGDDMPEGEEEGEGEDEGEEEAGKKR